MTSVLSITGAFLKSAAKPLLVVLGPTASGKTDFSIRLAHSVSAMDAAAKQGRGQVEIINADSRQLYRRLDRGTAKITRDEMQGVPHHLLDEKDPREELTAAEYQRLALGIIDEVLARGNIPMLVGGSMLYISAVIDGLCFPDASDPATRARLEKDYDMDEGITLHARLATVDPQSATAIPRQNKPYVVRAMELFEQSGRKAADRRSANDCPYDLLLFGIKRGRDELAERINMRTAQLLRSGWIDEVRSLVADGYGPADPGMKSHGYREIMEWLRTGGDEKELAESISAKTRQYAKRQMTWWRGDERIHWISGEVDLRP